MAHPFFPTANHPVSLVFAGFPSQKPVCTPVGPLPSPQNLLVRLGVVSGLLNASANPVFGAQTYNWTCTANTPGAVPITVQSGGQKSA